MSANIDLANCPICKSNNTRMFHSLDMVPTNSFRLTKSHEEAAALAQGYMRLTLCNECAFVYNAAFDQSLPIYDEHYEATQGFSGTFRQWTTDVISRFVNRYDLSGKRALELGCGQGEFIAELTKQTNSTATAYDPAWVPGFVDEDALKRVQYKQELFDEKNIGEQFDIFVHRHTLEHVADPVTHMAMVKNAMAKNKGSVMFLEVPDAERIWGEVAFWDVFYEHCNYFTKKTLKALLERCGFDVLDIRYEYSDQYLVAEAKVADEPVQASDVGIEKAQRDAEFFEDSFSHKRNEIETAMHESKRPVIWGGGSKGVGFLTTMGYGSNRVKYAVDIDPHKQGTFMAGSAQPVISPLDLKEHEPDLVVVMNPVYQTEIKAQLESIGINCDVIAL